MLRRMTRNGLKKALLAMLFATGTMGLTGLNSTTVSAAGDPRLWSVAAHFRQADGFEYDYIFATGVSTTELPAYLAACGESHRTGFVVWYHCYPIPE